MPIPFVCKFYWSLASEILEIWFYNLNFKNVDNIYIFNLIYYLFENYEKLKLF